MGTAPVSPADTQGPRAQLPAPLQHRPPIRVHRISLTAPSPGRFDPEDEEGLALNRQQHAKYLYGGLGQLPAGAVQCVTIVGRCSGMMHSRLAALSGCRFHIAGCLTHLDLLLDHAQVPCCVAALAQLQHAASCQAGQLRVQQRPRCRPVTQPRCLLLPPVQPGAA